MGKYLDFANQRLQSLKPQVEEKFGKRLEEIIVKDSHEYPHLNLYSDKLIDNRMFVARNYPNTIFLTEENHNEEGTSFYDIAYELTHELAHKIYAKLIKEDLIKRDISRPLKRYRRNQSFREGFAEYASLDFLLPIYDSQEFQKAMERGGHLGWYKKFSPEEKPYAEGYKFFRKVLSIIGKDKFFEVAKSPPISEVEMKFPILYLLRKYPFKGIKSIPKFLKHGLKTKFSRYGPSLFYALSSDFPMVKKGEGKGKVVKALPV